VSETLIDRTDAATFSSGECPWRFAEHLKPA